jgi:hypothetical protein
LKNKPAGLLDSMWSLNSFARCHSAWKVGTSHSFGASGYPPQFHGAKQGFCGRGCHRLLPLDWFLHDKERHLKTIPKRILDYGFHFFGVISEPEIQMSGCDEKTSCPSTPLSINWGILKGQQKILNGQVSVRLPQCCFQLVVEFAQGPNLIGSIIVKLFFTWVLFLLLCSIFGIAFVFPPAKLGNPLLSSLVQWGRCYQRNMSCGQTRFEKIKLWAKLAIFQK